MNKDEILKKIKGKLIDKTANCRRALRRQAPQGRQRRASNRAAEKAPSRALSSLQVFCTLLSRACPGVFRAFCTRR